MMVCMTGSIQQPFNADEEWLARPRRSTASRLSRWLVWRLGNFENLHFNCSFTSYYILFTFILTRGCAAPRSTISHPVPSALQQPLPFSTFLYSSLLFSTFYPLSFLAFSHSLSMFCIRLLLTISLRLAHMTTWRRSDIFQHLEDQATPLTNSDRCVSSQHQAQLRHFRDILCHDRGGNR